MLTAEQIRAINDKRIIKVDVPEWKGFVYIRAFTAEVKESMAAELTESKNKNVMAHFLSISICDEAGNLLLSKNDVDMLKEKDAAPVERIFREIMKLNAVGNGALDNAVKNS